MKYFLFLKEYNEVILIFKIKSNNANLRGYIHELQNIKNKKIKRDLKLQWSTKKEIVINNIMNDENIKDIKTKLSIIKQKFESIFDIIILFVQGNYDTIRNSLWEVLYNFKKLDSKIFKNIILNKIDYCIIYSIKSDNIIFKKLSKEENDNIDIDIDFDKNEGQDNNNIRNDKADNNKIISFYFLFNYLDDEDKTYNINNNNVVCW